MRFLPVLLGLVCVAVSLDASPEADMASAARTWLDALSPEQRGKAVFKVSDDERLNWHFIPKERKGLTLKEMDSAQRHLAYGLLSTGLSHRGYLKATTIMSLEQILQEIEGPTRRFPRDPELYHVSVFGEPAEKGTWGWRVEGHHLSLNFLVVNGRVASGAPNFFGTNPAEVRTEKRRGLRVLAAEEDLARELVLSLSDENRSRAVIEPKAPDDILTVASRKAVLKDERGVTVERLTSAQKELVRRLIREYAGRCRGEVMDEDLVRIERAGFERIRFAWAGGTARGEKHYYRLMGPTFLIEYDNTQNDGNHVHAVWRDLERDFGLDALGEHLEKEHGK